MVVRPPKIVLLDLNAFSVPVEIRRPHVPHRWTAYPDTAPDEIVERLADATVAITNGIGLSRRELEHLHRLELVAVCATGLDHIDTADCARRGITVCNAGDYATRVVAEHAFCLILALSRNLPAYLDDMRAGAWSASDRYSLASYAIHDLHGRRLGIIGAGAIGRAVARIGQAFAMDAVLAERKGRVPRGREYLPFDEVLATSDVLSLHCPLTDETRNLIDRPEFQAMGKRPLLINTARGALVNEHALVEALRRGQISGAGFDVASREPIDPGNPLLALADHPRFILTPHVAWASAQAQQALIDQVMAQVTRFLTTR